MKYFVLFFLITVFNQTRIAQIPAFKDICKKYNKQENTRSIRIDRLGHFMLSFFVKDNNPADNTAQNCIRQSSTWQLLIAKGGIFKN